MSGKRSSGAPRQRGALLIAFLQCAVLFLLFVALGALACSLSQDPSELSPAVGCFCYLFSGLLSGFLTAKRKLAGGLKYAVLSALAFSLILLFTGLILSGGHLSLSVSFSHPAYVSISFLGALIGGRKRNKRRS